MGAIASGITSLTSEINQMKPESKQLYCNTVKTVAVASAIVVTAATVCAAVSGAFLGMCVGGFTLLALRDIYQMASNVKSPGNQVVGFGLTFFKCDNKMLNQYTANTFFARSIIALAMQF